MLGKVDKGRPSIPEGDIAALLEDFAGILRSGRLTQGDFQWQLEEEFARYVGVRHAVAMSSGTAPLEIALRHFAVGGRDVIVPTNTFIASSNAVLLAGGRPVLADLDPRTLCSGLPQIEPCLTEETAGVVVVHVAGLVVPDIDDIKAWCQERSLFALEDAAHAHGAAIRGRRAGGLGDAAAFSFFPSKVMTSGEGGMLTTDDDELAAFGRSYRSHGQAADSRSLVRLGNNYRLPELSAALGLKQLRRLDAMIAERTALAQRYRDRLAELSGARLVETPDDQVNPYYKLPLVLPPGTSRDVVVPRLAELGIATGSIYWPPCHLEPYYRDLLGTSRGDFPIAEAILSRTITLPLYAGMAMEDVDTVCQALEELLTTD